MPETWPRLKIDLEAFYYCYQREYIDLVLYTLCCYCREDRSTVTSTRLHMLKIVKVIRTNCSYLLNVFYFIIGLCLGGNGPKINKWEP